MTEINKISATDFAQKSDSSTSPKPFRLIIHVGAGKTGTTSIQETLKSNREKLQAQGFWYLGLMLEHAPIIRYPWQVPEGFWDLMRLKDEEVTNQLVEVLGGSLSEIKSQSGHTAILSNESFFHNKKPLKDAIEVLLNKGWCIEAVAYVRRYDDWARSAYSQWGLKHKTYAGKLQPFSQWIKNADYRFGANLQLWLNCRGIVCAVRNADQAGDVVKDFFAYLGISMDGLSTQRLNEQLSTEELLLRALFNSQFSSGVLPYQFDRIMGTQNIDYGVSALSFLSSYLPTETELKTHLANCLPDASEVNQMLADNGQQPLDMTPKNFVNKEIDLGKVVATLFMMLAFQSKKLHHLEAKINKQTMPGEN